ncbi:hypothetical protein Rhopal_005381-T1 [Rhodotorula paludigena]|uniref:Proteasome assembly chaperone 2 n=1 Tax=Rhodotorula paludigena TaxID=86838 RepID=A0AAV5GS65_9BASI|nr:hypothetical protein Rhopal_005381-T1 [Rhodotorula paludigena]
MDYFVPLPGTQAPSFTGSTLLLPQPSLSSLAQLACDLLVHNLRLELVGYLGVRDYVPAVGGRDGLPGEAEKEGLALGTEVYTTPSRSLTLVLPRSPVIRARKEHHLQAISAWVAAGGFKDVLVVAGTDAAMRGDDGLNARRKGLTRSLLSALAAHAPTSPAAALLIYTSEGAAVDAAHYLASALVAVLGPQLEEVRGLVPLETQQLQLQVEGEEEEEEGARRWKEPRSWERGLMGPELGRDAGREMYG